ncbi:MAG: DUF1801 domain-containing protein [Bacteroidota bacterium]
MATLKTRPNDGDVKAFLDAVENEQKRADSYEILEMMQEITGETPKMWGGSIVGFGKYHFKYESGREGDWFLAGFSPRKQNLTLYIMAGFKRYEELLGKLGKYKTGRSCLYIKRLEQVDRSVLRELVTESVHQMREQDTAKE